MELQDLMETPQVHRLEEALCLLETPEEARALLIDLCTVREIADLSQRLNVAEMLEDGELYVTIQKKTGASSTTVSRVSRFLQQGPGGHEMILRKLREKDSAQE
jgi:TrpR-related protein YerC/YecD